MIIFFGFIKIYILYNLFIVQKTKTNTQINNNKNNNKKKKHKVQSKYRYSKNYFRLWELNYRPNETFRVNKIVKCSDENKSK